MDSSILKSLGQKKGLRHGCDLLNQINIEHTITNIYAINQDYSIHRYHLTVIVFDKL